MSDKIIFDNIESAIEDIRNGKMVIVIDDEDRENEGDFVMAADLVTPEAINIMVTHGRGLVCVPITRDKANQLNLDYMVTEGADPDEAAFTTSIDHKKLTTTGISASDRSNTIKEMASKDSIATDFRRPGHIFPLLAVKGGVLRRAGHTEAGCDLARIAGFEPAAVIVEIMNDDGTMARREDLEAFAKKHDLKIGTIADLIHYRLVTEKTISCINERAINTCYGEFALKTYLDSARNEKHFALVMGDVSTGEPPLVRVHINKSSRDLFGLEPNAGYKSWSLSRSMEKVAEEGRGVVVFLYYPESANDIDDSIERELNPVPTKPQKAGDVVYQQVGTGSQILMDLGVHKMRLLSAPFRFPAISGFDLEVVEYIPCE